MNQKLTSELLANSQIIRSPVGTEKGYWVGAPGAFYAGDENACYLTYRIRRPRGVEPDRGGEARIARSTDLANWEDIWTVTKDSYDSASIERSTIRKGPDGAWRYFTSYVDPVDGRWCVASIRANDPRKFDPAKRKIVFTAKPLGLEGVKDPWIFEDKGLFHMVLSVAVPTPKTNEGSHSTFDIYNTGECMSASGIATSHDLDNWEWKGVIFAPPGTGWDRYCTRINSIISQSGKYFAFYDGSTSHLENYEERTGIAVSDDLRKWKTLTPNGPALTSPHSSQCLRYMDVQMLGGKALVFYEMARPDAAHDLRLLQVDAPLF